jgi:acyl-CoA synthetase (AMP-forming)/AMP-acid ligase II/thioesterase domain-containing protein/acyl carrier protein
LNVITDHDPQDEASERAIGSAQTIGAIIRRNAARWPDRAAIVASREVSLTYAMLCREVDRIGVQLRAAGASRTSRIGVLLPDGPELAVAITAIACYAIAVPLNPSLTATELDEQFATLPMNFVVVGCGTEELVRDIACRHKTSLLNLTEKTRPASASSGGITSEPDNAGADDIAFILRTSGTTARPKLVPVSHRNLIAMAHKVQHWFDLSADDRCLCVMPLYYAQGLKTTLFVPLILGGSLACPSRGSAPDFLAWLAELEPTWYSAGPTHHRSVIERARAAPEGRLKHKLRFIQSAAAHLPDEVRLGLEAVFGVPVLESYGLSETGLVATNSVLPGKRKPGTSGITWRDETAVVSDEGETLASGQLGEIVVCGPGVMAGYVDNEEANSAAFRDGWFRTGDLGRIDSDGFLTIVGRIKELINRGGEKIAPLEIDRALLRHPAVAEASAFPVDHPRLGEDVAAAVVLRAGTRATALELRQFLQPILTPSKIPRRIFLVAALPKGDTGKVQRRRLSEMFKPGTAHSQSEPCSTLEIDLLAIWRRLLGLPTLDFNDDFFELGGDSLLAMQMLAEVETLLGRPIAPAVLFDAATIRQLAHRIATEDFAEPSLLVCLEARGSKPPLFFLDGDLGGGGYYAQKLARALGREQPFYVLKPIGLQDARFRTIAEMAREYLPHVTAARAGPYRLGGFCNGALIALELARQLREAGHEVEAVAMIDAMSLNARPGMRRFVGLLNSVLRLVLSEARRAEGCGRVMAQLWRMLQQLDRRVQKLFPWLAIIRRLKARDEGKAIDGDEVARWHREVDKKFFRAMASFVPAPLDVPLHCFIADANKRSAVWRWQAWRHVSREVTTSLVPGEHLTCVTTHIDALSAAFRAQIAGDGRVSIMPSSPAPMT